MRSGAVPLCTLAAGALFFSLAKAVPARAEPLAAATAQPTPQEPPVPARPGSQVPFYHRRWALFDPFFSTRENVLFGGPSSIREKHRSGVSGLALGFGQAMREDRGPLWLSLQREHSLTVHSNWGFMLGFARYTYEAGLKLGPVELGGGAGLLPVVIDQVHREWSLGGLSPRATARFGLKTGGFRVTLRGYREYLWRWLGRPNAVMTGFVIELAGEEARRTHWGGHPIVLVE